MGIVYLFQAIAWLICLTVTLLFTWMLDRFAMQRWFGRTNRALWAALGLGHAVNLVVFWSPFSSGSEGWALYLSTLAVAAVIIWLRRRDGESAIEETPFSQIEDGKSAE